jgi:energy-coupling factor transporter ATP-binding protein EcfA2
MNISPKGFAARHRQPIETLSDVRRRLSDLIKLEAAVGSELAQRLAELIHTADRLTDRLEQGPESPVLVVVMGATGTGKSKLFNSLCRTVLSPSGYKRPTTLDPVLLTPPEHLDNTERPGFLPDYAKIRRHGTAEFDPDKRALILVQNNHSQWPNLILADTPDFDSILDENRQAASDMFLRSDAVIFVTDAVKYADQTSWDYLQAIHQRRRAAVLVVNRLKNPLSLEDFQERLRTMEIDREVLGIKDRPDLGDADLFPSDLKALRRLVDALDEWNGVERPKLLARGVESDWEFLRDNLTRLVLPTMEKVAANTKGLETMLTDLAENAEERLSERLAVAISGEMKNSLINQIQQLFLRWDLLKYPRRLMAMPFNALRDRVLVPLGIMNRQSGTKGLEQELDRLNQANRQAMVTVIGDLNREIHGAFRDSTVGNRLADLPGFEELSLSPDDVKSLYDQERADLEAWVQDQAKVLVQGLNVGEKMTFYLAQVVYLGLFISIQVHTGGGFSFFDGLLDSVLAPVLSKITGSALSRDKVRAFESQAADKHIQGCRQIIKAQIEAYQDFIKPIQTGLTELPELVRAFETLGARFEKLK